MAMDGGIPATRHGARQTAPRGAVRGGGRTESATDALQSDPKLGRLHEMLRELVFRRFDLRATKRLPRGEIARQVSTLVVEALDGGEEAPDLLQQRHLVTLLIDDLIHAEPPSEDNAAASGPHAGAAAQAARGDSLDSLLSVTAERQPGAGEPQASRRMSLAEAKRKIKPLLLERIDVGAASRMPPEQLARELSGFVSEIREELRIQLNRPEHDELVSSLVDDMIGLGPLEPLLADDSITDIMVNGPHQVYVERNGKIELSRVRFHDDAHVLHVATRIVTRIGRRVDESSPICDARLADGSRVNVIIPPLALDGPSISIRKFSRRRITLDRMAEQANISHEMAKLLKIAARSRLNILISGGTGSGKTTLLNAMSQLIDHGERIVTIEDAAELQLQQPHIVRLETRPPNLEGKGEITIRNLVKNSLRMRPDRIIVGEVRGAEAVDMLQAMNTGHEGSMCTIHANKPRDALSRLENMVGMASINLPSRAVRQQIVSAVDMIVQVSRMRDGVRRVTNVSEIVGMEGEVITTQDLYTYRFEGEDERGRLKGQFVSAGVRPHFLTKAEYFGLGKALLEVI